MQYSEDKILITVKTYPTLSQKHDEIVCTAGIREDGSWVRLYPIPFRALDYDKRYAKYQWITVRVVRNKSDFRPESYTPDLDNLQTGTQIDTSPHGWHQRMEILARAKQYDSLKKLQSDAKDKHKYTSLAVFKPKRILDFKIESDAEEWDDKKLRVVRNRRKQQKLLGDDVNDLVDIAKKIPFKFSYVFKDIDDRESKMMIIDWEIGQLYLNCLRTADSETACRKVKEKYMKLAQERDIFLFLGTTKEFHNMAPNPFIIVGVFYPPKHIQKPLL